MAPTGMAPTGMAPTGMAPTGMAQLPRNMIVEIARRATKGVQARMKALSRNARDDPLMPTGTLPTGYLYGTGRHQREYNELGKRLLVLYGALKEAARGASLAPHERSFVSRAYFAWQQAVYKYRMAVRRRDGVDVTTRDEWLLPAYGGAAELPPEQFMDLTIQRIRAILRSPVISAYARQAFANDGRVSRILQEHRRTGKADVGAFFRQHPSNVYETPANRRAARLERRAARRAARQAARQAARKAPRAPRQG